MRRGRRAINVVGGAGEWKQRGRTPRGRSGTRRGETTNDTNHANAGTEAEVTEETLMKYEWAGVYAERHLGELVVAAPGAKTMIHHNLLCLLLAAMGADTENGTQAGKFVVEHATLLNLGFEWEIRGDANRNAAVTVQFRPVGESAWRLALPLVRIGGENIYRRRENLDYTVPDGFAGSILNLQSGTEYECQFDLTDPDGTSGQTTHTVRVKTRVEPQPAKEGRTLHVYPPDHQGPRQEPSFTSLLQAYEAFSSDYNGFRPNKGVAGQYTWLGPKRGQRLYEAGTRGLEEHCNAGRIPHGNRTGNARRRSRFRLLRAPGSA